MQTGVKHTNDYTDLKKEWLRAAALIAEIKRKELAVQLREAAVSNCSFPQDSPLGKPFHVEVHSHRGCGNCYWWCPEDHDCTRPGDCDHLSGWRSRDEDNT